MSDQDDRKPPPVSNADTGMPSRGAVFAHSVIIAAITGAIAGAITANFNLPLPASAIPFIVTYKLFRGAFQPFLTFLVAMLVGLLVIKLSLIAIDFAKSTQPPATNARQSCLYPLRLVSTTDTDSLTPATANRRPT